MVIVAKIIKLIKIIFMLKYFTAQTVISAKNASDCPHMFYAIKKFNYGGVHLFEFKHQKLKISRDWRNYWNKFLSIANRYFRFPRDLLSIL